MARHIPRRGERRRHEPGHNGTHPDNVTSLAERRGGSLSKAVTSPAPLGGIGHSSLGPNMGVLPNIQPASSSSAMGAQGGVPTMYTAFNGANPTGRPYPPMETIKDTRPSLNVYGATGTAIFGGIITSEEYHPDFFWKDAVKIYEQMLRGDPMINALRLALEQPLKAATWSVVPASNDDVDKEIASFVESCLFHDMEYTTADGVVLRQSWDSLLHHILMHWWYGFMALEQIWRIEDGFVKWAKWTPLLPRTVWRWWVGPDNELAGIQQWTFKDYTYQYQNIPAGKLLLFVNRQEGNNFEGVSRLRTAYKPWWYLNNMEKIEAVGLERNAFSVPVVYLPNPHTASDLSFAQTVAQNIRVNELAGITLPGPKGHPEGFELDYPHTGSRGAPQVQPSIQYHLTQMARNVLAMHIMNGSQENGTRAMDSTQRAGFLDALQGDASYIEGIINQGAIRRLVDYNYVDVGIYPQVRCSRLRAQDLEQLANLLKDLGPMGGGFLTPTPETEDMLRKEAGLPSAPISQVEATNPSYMPLDNGMVGESGDASTAEDNEAGYGEAADAQNQEPSSAPGEQSPAAAGASVSGANLSEMATEIWLLREAINGVYGKDAVGSGVIRLVGGHHQGYGGVPGEQGHGVHGHWTVGQGPQAGGGSGKAKVEAQRESGTGSGGGGGGGKWTYEGAVRALEGARAKEGRAAAAHAKAKPALNRAMENANRANRSGDQERMTRASQRLNRASLTHDKAELAHLRATAARKDAEQRVSGAAHAEAVVARNRAGGGGGVKAKADPVERARQRYEAAQKAHEDLMKQIHDHPERPTDRIAGEIGRNLARTKAAYERAQTAATGGSGAANTTTTGATRAPKAATAKAPKSDEQLVAAHQAKIAKAQTKFDQASRAYGEHMDRMAHAAEKVQPIGGNAHTAMELGRARDQALKALHKLQAQDPLAPKAAAAPRAPRQVKSPQERAAAAQAKVDARNAQRERNAAAGQRTHQRMETLVAATRSAEEVHAAKVAKAQAKVETLRATVRQHDEAQLRYQAGAREANAALRQEHFIKGLDAAQQLRRAEGALTRLQAKGLTPATAAKAIGATRAPKAAAAGKAAKVPLPNPFEHVNEGVASVRAHLASESAARLRQVIATHRLDPGGQMKGVRDPAVLANHIAERIMFRVRQGEAIR